ncbi:MAG: primosomal protein N' [Scytolyngbya sp. HA4215-MV1]|jgi:primosomal protein N' (replication factor Y)|nr:primosomal protein N' [Scytolyngbya sp. HA4215-MV1]
MFANPLGISAPILAEAGGHYPTPPVEQWVEVLVDCPGAPGVFTYQLPPQISVQVGDILTVPFGSQQVGAIALCLLKTLPAHIDLVQVKPIHEVVSRSFFPANYWTLLQKVAHYYYTPLMQVVRAALPPGLLSRSQRRIRLKAQQPELDAQKPEQSGLNLGTEFTHSTQNLNFTPHTAFFRTSTAQPILELLQRSKTGDYTWQYLQRHIPGARQGLQELLQQGFVESYLEPPTPIRPKVRQAVILTATAFQHLESLSPRQREILDILKREGGDLWLSDLLQRSHTTSTTLKNLEQKGCVTLQPREVLRAEAGGTLQSDCPKRLTATQALALEQIITLTGTAQVLLHGVTGSGKTEVYLQAIAPILQRGQSVLVLVPEIGLTPQLTDRFRARFGSQVRVYHSALSEGERYDTWRQMLHAQPQVVIGTRSAIFAPLPNLGLIVLDEEHDASFKQDQPAPCYHARTVAQWRSQLDHCPLILGSATPSLESWVTAQVANITPINSCDPDLTFPVEAPSLYLTLPDRVYNRPMPEVEVIDMRQELQQGNPSIFSRRLQSALQDLREKQQQGILFIHRRGHSTFVSCRSCGYVIDCPNCDVSLSYHHSHTEATPLLRCHYCNYTRLHPPRCPECSSPYLKFFGSGTQRVVQELSRQFPDLRCLRFDSDTTRTKGSHRAILSQFASGTADLLVGTQMLTKGIDLPQVTLVGVVAADGLLNLSDFRAGERAFQTLTQVIGRAGRGEIPGRAIVQTYTPSHPVIAAVHQHDYTRFVETELAQRAELNYPPRGRLILLRLSSPEAVAVQQAADRVATTLMPSNSTYELLGPAPAGIFRMARRYRWQILLKSLPDTTLPLPDINELRALCPASVSLTIDIDPLNFL